MDSVFGFRPHQPVSWFATDKRRSNQHCLYCGEFVGQGSAIVSNREHLLARRFVPPGKLDATSFNFIFRACVDCNGRKADAERHVSSVSLNTSRGRIEDAAVDAAAAHKAATDFHPSAPGKRVRDATIEHTVGGRFGSAEFSFKLAGPPQLETERACLLACNQIQALFSLVTTRDPRYAESTKVLPASNWHYFGIVPWSDWGNAQVVEIANRVRNWPVIARITSANGYFRAVLRPHEEPEREWFWALEWNRSVRVIGGIFSEGMDPPLFADLPSLPWKRVGPTTRMRAEIPEPDDVDLLFGD